VIAVGAIAVAVLLRTPRRPVVAPVAATRDDAGASGSAGLGGAGGDGGGAGAVASTAGSGGRPNVVRRTPVPDSEVQAMVMATRGDVRASCWETARAPGGETSAQVTLAITIDGEGRVTTATVTGANAFPGLAACLAARAKAWAFSKGHSRTEASASYNFKTE
jgi:hypothetical protein